MVADTFSNTLGYLVMGTGNDNNSWGNNANNDVFQIVEDAIANALTLSVTGGTLNLSGTPPPNGPSQVHYAALIFTGTLTSNQIIEVPNLTKYWWVNNQTSGAFTLSIQTPTGSGSIIAPGTITGGGSYTNGTYLNVHLTGGTGFGAVADITVAGNIVTVVTMVDAGFEYLPTDSLSATFGGGSGFALSSNTIGNLIPQNSGWQLSQCDGSGNIIVSPFNSMQIQMPGGSALAPSFSNVNESNSGWYRNSIQDWRLAIGGIDVLQVTGAGGTPPSAFNLLSGNVATFVPSGTILPYAGPTIPSGFIFPIGGTVPRATYPNLLTALRMQFTATFTSGNATLSSTSINLAGLGLESGVLESATPGISGLTVSAVASSTSITMSSTASASSGGPVTCYIYPYGNGDGSTTFGIPDYRGRGLFGRDNMASTSTTGAGRITQAVSAITGYVLGLLGTGGSQGVALTQANLPNLTYTVSIPAGQGSHTHTTTALAWGDTSGNIAPTGGSIPIGGISINSATLPAMTGSFNTGGTSASSLNVPPAAVCNFILKT